MSIVHVDTLDELIQSIPRGAIVFEGVPCLTAKRFEEFGLGEMCYLQPARNGEVQVHLPTGKLAGSLPCQDLAKNALSARGIRVLSVH